MKYNNVRLNDSTALLPGWRWLANPGGEGEGGRGAAGAQLALNALRWAGCPAARRYPSAYPRYWAVGGDSMVGWWWCVCVR
jgi:hypothetical protein